jgi:hypothetical protein
VGTKPVKSGRVSAARRLELEVRFREIEADIVRQRRIIKELVEDGHSSVGTNTVLRLLENEQAVIEQELGYNPRLN